MDNYSADISIVLGTLVFTMLAVALVVFSIIAKRKQLRLYAERLRMQHQFQTQLLQSRLEVQEQSFQYFSEEIHDNVGQILSVVGMYLYRLQNECTGEHEQLLVQQSSDLLNKAISDLRSISHTLNAQYINKAGLVEVLRQEVEYINSVKSAKCTVVVNGNPEELSADRQTLLYRIIQEAITNALRHGHATEIIITLRFDRQTLTTTIADNGKGFDPSTVSETTSGLGLTNMQLRAKLLGGTLDIQSTSSQGTILSLTIDPTPTKPITYEHTN